MGKRVMVVDDSIFMRMQIKNILQEAGHEIITEAGNGEEAIKNYETHKPDVITLDITMPGMDGLVALEKIKEIDSKAKIIMISAIGNDKNIIKALKLGALDFIEKPFDPTNIREKIAPREIMSTRRSRPMRIPVGWPRSTLGVRRLSYLSAV